MQSEAIQCNSAHHSTLLQRSAVQCSIIQYERGIMWTKHFQWDFQVVFPSKYWWMAKGSTHMKMLCQKLDRFLKKIGLRRCYLSFFPRNQNVYFFFPVEFIGLEITKEISKELKKQKQKTKAHWKHLFLWTVWKPTDATLKVKIRRNKPVLAVDHSIRLYV